MGFAAREARTVAAAVVAVAGAGLVAWDLTRSAPGRLLVMDAAAWLLTAVGVLALRWRNRRPVAVAVLVLVCVAGFFPLSDRDVPILLVAFFVALYAVSAQGHLRASVVIAVVAMGGLVAGELWSGRGRNVDNVALFLLAGWFAGLIAVGQALRTRQAYLREAEARAVAAERERLAAEGEKEARARQAAVEERLRIARELHDVLGHHISLITVQAGAAVHRHTKRGGAADGSDDADVRALAAIRDAGREALRELRATLGVLRQVDEPAPTAPADADLAERLHGIAEGARAAGLTVRSDVEAGVDRAGGVPLPPEVRLAACRIVQESLTNTLKHAGARAAAVHVRTEGAGVAVHISDDGGPDDGTGAGPVPATGSGSGLRGMVERARALGGHLDAGPARDGGGWTVEAWLPLPQPEPLPDVRGRHEEGER